MKSPHPHEGKEYCRKLYEEVIGLPMEEVKKGHFEGKQSEAGEQFNAITKYLSFILDATIITSNLNDC